MLIAFFTVSILVFSLSSFSSGNIYYFILGESADSTRIAEFEDDEPFLLSYFEFLKDFFTLDWGENLQGYSILDLVRERSAVTLEIMLITLIISIPLSVVLSCLSIRKEHGLLDRATDLAMLTVFSLPSFSIAFFLILVFSFYIPVFPISGYISMETSISGNLRTVFLPSLALSVMHTSLYVRVLKKSLSREMGKNYIRGAIARGKRADYIVFSEALRPASVSLIALSGQSASTLIAGSAVTETVFSIPGLGSLIVSAAMQRDVKTATIILMLVAIAVSVIGVASRIICLAVDPRGVGNE